MPVITRTFLGHDKATMHRKIEFAQKQKKYIRSMKHKQMQIQMIDNDCCIIIIIFGCQQIAKRKTARVEKNKTN